MLTGDPSHSMHSLIKVNCALPIKVSAQKRPSYFCSYFIGWHMTLPCLISQKVERYNFIIYSEEREMGFVWAIVIRSSVQLLNPTIVQNTSLRKARSSLSWGPSSLPSGWRVKVIIWDLSHVLLRYSMGRDTKSKWKETSLALTQATATENNKITPTNACFQKEERCEAHNYCPGKF